MPRKNEKENRVNKNTLTVHNHLLVEYVERIQNNVSLLPKVVLFGQPNKKRSLSHDILGFFFFFFFFWDGDAWTILAKPNKEQDKLESPS